MPHPSDSPLTAKDALAIIAALSIEERTKLFKALDYRPGLSKGTGYVTLPKDIIDVLQTVIKNAVEHEIEAFGLLKDLGNKLAARTPKPRKTGRDDEIVRLRDKEGKTFGEIPRLLAQKNPVWCGKGDKPMSRDAVEKAYHRRKDLGTN